VKKAAARANRDAREIDPRRLALERGELQLNVFDGAAVVSVLDAIEMMRACA